MKNAHIQVKYVDHCGTDLTVVNAARQSFDKRSDWACPQTQSLSDNDKSLLRYLSRGMPTNEYNQLLESLSETSNIDEIEQKVWQFRNTPVHDTPFNHCFLTVDVKAPIYTRAQLVKHEYMIMSEFSRRYITSNLEVYLPLVWRFAAKNVKQGSSSDQINFEHLEDMISELQKSKTIQSTIESSIETYTSILSDHNICPELARSILPQCLMTSWTWSGTLGAFAKMCTLRLDPHSQLESQLVAQQVREILYKHFPVSAPLLIKGSFRQ